MVMEDIFIQMETIILETGKMEKDQDGENQSTSQERSMRECGSIANTWVTDYLSDSM